jgi:hypothetical protein
MSSNGILVVVVVVRRLLKKEKKMHHHTTYYDLGRGVEKQKNIDQSSSFISNKDTPRRSFGASFVPAIRAGAPQCDRK